MSRAARDRRGKVSPHTPQCGVRVSPPLYHYWIYNISVAASALERKVVITVVRGCKTQ